MATKTLVASEVIVLLHRPPRNIVNLNAAQCCRNKAVEYELCILDVNAFNVLIFRASYLLLPSSRRQVAARTNDFKDKNQHSY